MRVSKRCAGRIRTFSQQYRPTFEFNYCSRILSERTVLKTVVLESAALGSNDVHRLDMTGRAMIDVYYYSKSNDKMTRYRLKDVCAKYLPKGSSSEDNKIDLPYEELFRLYRTGDPKEMAKIAEYAAKDGILPIKILFTGILQDQMEMSRICRTPLPQLSTRGQQIKVFRQLCVYSYKWGFAFNFERISRPDNYVGATVIAPKWGYYDEFICTLDFASLYPSIMQAHNLCPSTLILERDKKRFAKTNIPVEKCNVEGNEYWFVHRSAFTGLVPKMLKFLFATRKAVKKS